MSDFRTVLHSIYSFIRSIEVNKATAALTLDHMLQEQITRLKGGSSRPILDSKGESLGNRISYLDTLDAMEKDLNALVKEVDAAGSDPDKLEELGLNQNISNEGSATV